VATELGLFAKLNFQGDQAVQGMKRSSSAFAGLRKSAKGAQTAAQGLRQSLTPVAIGSAAVAGATALAVRGAVEFQTGLAKVNTLLGPAGDGLEDYGIGLIQLGADFGKTTSDVSEGLFQAISAGVETTKVMDFMSVAQKAAAAGFTETRTAVDGLTNIMNAYGKTSDEALSISDSIFIANKLGKTTFEEIARTIGRVASQASASNISLNELLSVVVSVTKGGIRTSEVMSGLKAALANVGKPTKDAKDEAARLGIKFNTAALQAKGFAGFLADVQRATGGDIKSLQKLFGSVEAVNVVTRLTSKAGFNDLKVSLAAMESGAGTTEEAFQKVAQTTGFQLQRMSSALKSTGAAFGAFALPLLTGPFSRVSDHLKDAAVAFQIYSTDVDKRTPKMREQLEGMSTSVKEFAEGIREGVSSVKAGFATVRGVLGDVAGVFGFEGSSREMGKLVVQVAAIAPAILAAVGALKVLGMGFGVVAGLAKTAVGTTQMLAPAARLGGRGLRGLGRLLGRGASRLFGGRVIGGIGEAATAAASTVTRQGTPVWVTNVSEFGSVVGGGVGDALLGKTGATGLGAASAKAAAAGGLGFGSKLAMAAGPLALLTTGLVLFGKAVGDSINLIGDYEGLAARSPLRKMIADERKAAKERADQQKAEKQKEARLNRELFGGQTTLETLKVGQTLGGRFEETARQQLRSQAEKLAATGDVSNTAKVLRAMDLPFIMKETAAGLPEISLAKKEMAQLDQLRNRIERGKTLTDTQEDQLVRLGQMEKYLSDISRILGVTVAGQRFEASLQVNLDGREIAQALVERNLTDLKGRGESPSPEDERLIQFTGNPELRKAKPKP